MVDAAFVTGDELAAFTGAAGPPAAADLMCELASGVVRRYCGQRISFVPGDVWTVPDDPRTLERRLAWLPGLDATYGRSDLVIPLPERPVLAVTAVKGLIENVGFRVAAGILLVSSTALWTWPLTVTYDHGYQSIPAEIKTVTLRLAAKFLSNPAGLRSETIGGYSYTSAAGEAELTDSDRRLLADYRPRLATLSVTTTA